MPDRIVYRGFTVSYQEIVNELISPIKFLPILSADESNSKNPVDVDALWDTGAMVTCMKPSLWENLLIRPFDTSNRIELTGIGGSVKTLFTIANLFLAPNLLIEFCPVYILDFPGNTDILIGMDIIGMGDFVVCNANNKTSFSFAIPPFPDRIDLVEKVDAANKLTGD